MHVARRSGDLTATFVDPFTRERVPIFRFKKALFYTAPVGWVVNKNLASVCINPSQSTRPSPSFVPLQPDPLPPLSLITGEGLPDSLASESGQ